MRSAISSLILHTISDYKIRNVRSPPTTAAGRSAMTCISNPSNRFNHYHIHSMKHLRTIPLTAAVSALVPGTMLAARPDKAPEPAENPDHINFVLINLDDAGLGDFSYTGAVNYKTPNIDRLAGEGMRFTNFYAVQPISGASRAGLLTGCYPNRIGFAHAPSPGCPYGINDSEETIAEVLK